MLMVAAPYKYKYSYWLFRFTFIKVVYKQYEHKLQLTINYLASYLFFY